MQIARLNKLSRYIYGILIALLFVCAIQPGFAAPIKAHRATLEEYLAQEKSHLQNSLEEVRQYVLPESEPGYQQQFKQLTGMLMMTEAKIDSLKKFQETQHKQQEHLNQRLKYLQQLPVINSEVSVEEQVQKIYSSIASNTKSMQLIDENTALAEEFHALLKDKITDLQQWDAHFALEEQLRVIKNKVDALNQQLTVLYQKNTQPLPDKLKKPSKQAKPVPLMQYEQQLFVNNQEIAVIQEQINAFSIQKSVIKANMVLLKTVNTKTLQFITDVYTDSINQYNAIEQSLQQLSGSLNTKSSLFLEPAFKPAIKSLQTGIGAQIKEVGEQKRKLATRLQDYQAQLRKLTSSRQRLAEYSMNSWPIIIKKITEIPGQAYHYISLLALKVYDSYTWLSLLAKVTLWSILASLCIAFFALNRFLKTLASDTERSRLTGYLYDGAVAVVQRNSLHLCLFSMIWVTLYLTNISYANYQLLFNLLLVWITFRMLIVMARLALLERISDSSGKDVKLYYRLKWLLLFGGWTTALMVFSHILPLTLILQDIFNRLFMLFILTVSLVAWKSKDVIPYLLMPLLKSRKRYFKNALSLLVVLVPITLFTTAIIGLVGYVNLAWALSRYQAYTLIVLVGYILARGLMFDALEIVSEWMISSLRNGWLWIEVFLKPLDAVLRVSLFVAGAFVLCQLFGWHSDSLVISSIEKLSQYYVVNLTGIHITVASLIEFAALLALFVWISRWTREFCFRWLFRNIKDVGIRNSFSAFTQYAVILLGAFITLHVLGVDFSGMSMILGGLAVGMGFGLRDFASNVVGGIMLLIERPVREGDLITLGEYEGQVAHIGIRSMRVSTWDNTQVLIPNAETFNKPFTNWTHQDGIVRTVIPIKVSRSDDPQIIQQLILDVLAIVPEIAPDPPVQVFLKQIDQALIEFEVRYFINVQVHNRVEIRSKVLFAITAQFKAANIKPPIEPISIEFKEGQSDFQLKTGATTE